MPKRADTKSRVVGQDVGKGSTQTESAHASGRMYNLGGWAVHDSVVDLRIVVMLASTVAFHTARVFEVMPSHTFLQPCLVQQLDLQV